MSTKFPWRRSPLFCIAPAGVTLAVPFTQPNPKMTDAPPLPILACLRWDASGDAALAGLDCAGWQTLMAALRAGQGHAFLDRRLLLSPVAVAVPEWVRSEVHRQALATVARTLRTTSSLSACLGEAGCAVLALKGLDLAHRVYPHPGVRPMGDFDLLVAPEAVAVDPALDQRARRAAGFVAAEGAQVAQGGEKFVVGFAQADHQARLGDNAWLARLEGLE